MSSRLYDSRTGSYPVWRLAQTRRPVPCRASNGNRGVIMTLPSDPSTRNPSPFAASWPWSPARSTPRPQRSATCGCSNPPFRPTVPGSSRRQPAPGAHWHRKPSIEPRFFASRARRIAPFFVLDGNGVLPRNRWERKNGEKMSPMNAQF